MKSEFYKNRQIKTECDKYSHILLCSFVLCDNFARENHNYPFCSPAFIL